MFKIEKATSIIPEKDYGKPSFAESLAASIKRIKIAEESLGQAVTASANKKGDVSTNAELDEFQITRAAELAAEDYIKKLFNLV